MKIYADVTLLILFLCFVASVAWAAVTFLRCAKDDRSGEVVALPEPPLVPGLVLAPLLLVLGYRFLSYNFIFPVRLAATASEIFVASLAPAAVLLFASGLISVTSRNVAVEYALWRQRSFYLFLRSLGLNADRQLFPLVTVKAVAEAWGKCLPWLFGELLIVEVVFNAPGIAYDAWTFAKQRRFEAIWQPILVMAGIYIFIYIVVISVNHWLGKRLESYA